MSVLRWTGRLAAVATTAAALAGPLAAAPALAEPGEGCVGAPSIPATFVCIVELDPENATPSVTLGSGQTVVVPSVCYLAGCTQDTPVTLPKPVVTPQPGAVVVVKYQGQTYTVYGGGADLSPLLNVVNGVVDLVLDAVEDAGPVVENYRDYVDAQVANAVETALGLADTVLERYRDLRDQVDEIVGNLPTADEIVDAVTRLVAEYRSLVNEIRYAVTELVNNLVDYVVEAICLPCLTQK